MTYLPPPPPPAPVAPKKPRRWPIYLAAAIVVIIVIAVASGNKKKTPKAAAQTTSQTTSTPTHARTPTNAPATVVAATTHTGPTISNQAARWVKNEASAAQYVQVEVSSIKVEIALASGGQATQSDIDQLAIDAQTVHDNLDNARSGFAMAADGTGQIQNLENEAYSGVNDLKNSMGALVAYSGDPNAATLAHFVGQYQQGVGEWDESVQGLYSAAGQSNPPTIGS